jgi:hypothetical protein
MHKKVFEITTPEEIKTIMEKNQSIYFTGGYTPGTTINMDETAYTYAIGPKYAFVPKDSERGESLPGEDEKLRVTAVISVTTEGNFLPNMIIIKHSRKSDDETHFRVIKSLHKLPGFGREDSWEVKEWSKIIPRKNKNTNQIEQIKHKAFYLINLVNGQVITSQHNAWMDEVKMSMYVDVILKTFKEENSKLFLWMDNCPSHCTQFIKNELTNNSIDYALFPPNMTAILQILDLVVNGPIKAHTRKKNALRTYYQFQEYLGFVEGVMEVKPDDEVMKIPEFYMAKPSLAEAILDLVELTTQQFNNADFKNSIAQSSIKAGIIPEGTGAFRPVESAMSERTKGTLGTATGLIATGICITNSLKYSENEELSDAESDISTDDEEEQE